MKKIVLCSFSLLFIWTSIAMATINISIPEVLGEPGQSVNVPINVDDATGIAGASIVITFDSTILSATDVSKTELTSNFQLESNLIAEEVRISMAEAVGLTGGSGAIALITFKVSDTASIGSTSKLEFSKNNLYDENAEAFDVSAVDGTFMVGVPPITVTVSGSPAKAGETITVIVTTESSGGQAQFSIEGIVSELEMTENPQKAGEYTGTYTAVGGDNVQDTPVIVVFTTSAGHSITDNSKTVTIDTIPPDIKSVEAIGSPAKPGEEVVIVLTGENDCSATFSIEGVVEGISMSEISDTPGVYEGTYTAVEGIFATNAIVTVTLTDAVGNIGTNTSQTVTLKGISEFTLKLSAGVNFISVPLQPEREMKLSDLSAYIGDVTMIVWHNPAKGEFVSYLPTHPMTAPSNAIVEGGKGYIVIMKVPKEVTFEGIEWDGTVSLSAGVNSISVPLQPEREMKLSDLSAYIGDVTMIVWHNPAKGEFVSYLPTQPVNSPTNTVVEGGRGYIVLMKTPKQVTFEGEAWENTVQ